VPCPANAELEHTAAVPVRLGAAMRAEAGDGLALWDAQSARESGRGSSVSPSGVDHQPS
jgi:hypothetical protein